ncbi:MAG: DUF6686 family protein [Bacteroidota bacterium]
MDTCEFEVIISNRQGVATRCKCCGGLNVGYGQFMLLFNADSFEGFLADIKLHYKRRNLPGEDRRLKNIFIKTPAKEVSLLFCLDELSEFINFLQKIEDSLLAKKLARRISESPDWSCMN